MERKKYLALSKTSTGESLKLGGGQTVTVSCYAMAMGIQTTAAIQCMNTVHDLLNSCVCPPRFVV